MKNLLELRKKMMAIPSRFASKLSSTADIKEADFGRALSDTDVSFGGGFPTPFSKDPKETGINGEYIQRNDLNRIGEIASREAFYKQNGGVYFFDEDVSEKFSGYSKGSMLGFYDGVCLTNYESQISFNKNKIFNAHGNLNATWRLCSHIYGVQENSFSVELDYSHATTHSASVTVEQDSYVIGTQYFFGGMGATMNSKTTCGAGSISIPNKGHLSEEVKTITNDVVVFNVVIFNGQVFVGSKTYSFASPIQSKTGGGANYSFAFFAKANTKISTTYSVSGNTKPIEWIVVPIRTKVLASTYNREENNNASVTQP